MRKANWDNLKEEIDQKINNIDLPEHMNIEQLDNKIDQWYTIVKGSMEKHIPKKSSLTTQRPISSPELNHLQHRFNQLLRHARIHGFTNIQYHTYKTIQQKIKEECIKIRDNNYTKTLKRISDSHKDPQKFWGLVKRLKATQAPTNQYIIKDNNKLTESKEKEKAFRNIWQDIFRISREENALFDRENERMVENYLKNNKEILNTYDKSDLTRLQGTHHTDTLISQTEIQTTIKNLKNYTPGESQIGKQNNSKKSPSISSN